MFLKKNFSNTNDLSTFINGKDVYNSRLIDLISKSTDQKVQYIITEKKYRPDLIAKEVYGSPDYLGLLMIQTGSSLENFRKGASLSLLTKSTLDNLINSL